MRIPRLADGTVEHTLKPPAALLHGHALLIIDVGAGIRPARWWFADAGVLHVEPCEAYASVLRRAGFAVIQRDALDYFSGHDTFRAPDVVLMLDVIEHMPRDEGEAVIALATARARQVVVFTPKGFKPQEGDAWELGGEEWQRHRSGWTPDDFPGWTIEDRGDAFFAIWTRASTAN